MRCPPGVENVDSVIATLGDRIDGNTAPCAAGSRHAPVWDGAEVRGHGDLLPGNLLVHAGRLAAVIDLGGSPWATLRGGRPMS